MAFYQRLYCVSVSDHTTTKMWLVTVSKERVKWHKLEDRNNSWGNVHRVNGHLFGKAVLGEEINNFYKVIVTWGWPSEKIPMGVNLIEHLVAKKCRWKSYVIALFRHIRGLMVPLSMRRCGKWEAGRPAMLFQSPVWTPHPCTQHSGVHSRPIGESCPHS